MGSTIGTYIKLCTAEEISVGTILYSQGNQNGGVYFCGIININSSNNGTFNAELIKISGKIQESNIKLYYRKNNGKYELAVKNTDSYIFHNAISNSNNILIIQEVIQSIDGWTELEG